MEQQTGAMEGDDIMMSNAFYKGKKVLITGNTGFKGSWLCQMLLDAGAKVHGYSLEPPTQENLYDILKLHQNVETVTGDVRDYEMLADTMQNKQPEIVIHLAAQPIVRESYARARETFDINVMGTVNVLESVRHCGSVKSVLNVTTDKVYENKEWCWGYREHDTLNGFDPYSNSKSCSELVTQSYRKSFFDGSGIAISTARAGNVIGGGDFAADRIIPDCVRAARRGQKIKVRNPYSVRPYQHVLDALSAYLLLIEKQCQDLCLQGEYNVGPEEDSCVSTGELVSMFCSKWQQGQEWEVCKESHPLHESSFLRLDCSKIKSRLGWKSTWGIEESIERTVDWSKGWINDPKSICALTKMQIHEFMHR